MPEAFTKDPQAVLDYRFDWTPWLATPETISTHVVTVPSGLTLESSAQTDSNKSVTAWLSGGVAGKSYRVTCRVVTSQGRTDERSAIINVVER